VREEVVDRQWPRPEVRLLLLSLYGLYLLYLGLPVPMHTPTERRPLYFAVLVLIGIVVAAATGFLAGMAFP
jgi:hypothetical protein